MISGIVKRVIAQNGSPVADWGVITDSKFMENTTEIVGERLGCSHQDTFRLVDCVGTRLNEIKMLKMKVRSLFVSVSLFLTFLTSK